MISCPYCGHDVSTGTLANGAIATCLSCGNLIRVLLMPPLSWDRIKAKLGIYSFLVRELEAEKGLSLTICPVCGVPFFGGYVCKTCRRCLTCKESVEDTGDGVKCSSCGRKWDWQEYINRKQVLEEGKW